MRKVYLHGRLGRKFGKEFDLNVSTAGEAIRAFGSQIKGFYEELSIGSYRVVRGDKRKGMDLEIEDISEFNLGKSDLHIIPMAKGSKNSGGTVKTVIGVALIAAAVVFSGGTLAAPLAGMSGAALGGLTTYGNLAMMGLALALTGVSSLLTPNKKNEAKNDTSFTLNGPSNTSEQGVAVPLVYGDIVTGGVLVSTGLDVEIIPVGWDPLYGDTTPYAGD